MLGKDADRKENYKEKNMNKITYGKNKSRLRIIF